MAKAPRHPFDLILRYLPAWSPKTIFDVGANVGQSAEIYAKAFPEAHIHSFEPSPGAYQGLVAAMKEFPGVTPHCVALGRAEATLSMTQIEKSTMNRLLPGDQDQPEGAIKVQVRPGATVMRELEVEHIDYLKIDTEGHDLEVLIGFLPSIERIDFIQVEAGMNPYNSTHVPFGKLDDFLKGEGFHLLYLFEQRVEWKRGGQLALRRSNPVYTNKRLVNLRGIR